MLDCDLSTMDFVRELRLRQWARQHFVPEQERRATWHPVVLDEMKLRDQEILTELATAHEAQIVAAAIPESPAFEAAAPSPEPVTQSHVEETTYQRQWGSTFVPLAPSTQWKLHEGSSAVPKPHGRMLSREAYEAIESVYQFEIARIS